MTSSIVGQTPDAIEGRRWLPRFITIWAGQAASQFGSQVAQFALVWWITQTTGSAMALSLATLCAIVPSVIIMPFAGALIDRWSRRKIMLVSDTLSAVIALSLAGLFVSGQPRLELIYAAILLRSALGAFQFPAMQAATSTLVPGQHLTRVGGLNQMLQGAMGIFAPATGALVISVAPIAAAMGIDVLTALMAVVPLLFIAIPQPARRAATGDGVEPRTGLLQEMREGLRYLLGHRGLLFVGLVAALLNFLLTPAGALMPLLITGHFRGGAAELAGIEAVGGIGLVLGGVLMGITGGFKRKSDNLIIGGAGIGLGIGLIGLVPAEFFVLAMVAMFLTSIAQATANATAMALFQSEVPPDMVGRVMSLLGTASMGISPLSLLIAGPFGEAFGPRPWLVMAGVFSIVVCAVGGLSAQVRALGMRPPPHAQTPAPQS